MTEISIQCEVDGEAAPGFPWLGSRTFRQFYRRFDRLTNTTDWQNVLPTLDADVTYRVGFLMIYATVTIELTVADTDASNTTTLTAGNLFLVAGANAQHTNAAPFVRVKPAQAGTIFVAAGIL